MTTENRIKDISDVVSEFYVPADGPNLYNFLQNQMVKKDSLL
jgi:hypothetical protein